MKIYLQNPEKTRIQVFETENQIGAGFANWTTLTESEILVYELQKAKNSKLLDLETFHNKVKTIKINGFDISIDPAFRSMIAEQINKLRIRLSSGKIKQEEAYFDYWISGNAVRLSLSNLEFIYDEVMEIIDYNFYVAKQKAIINIKRAKTIEELEFDYNDLYRLNQSITIKL